MRAKQFLELYEAQQQLFEVEMSPSNLKKLAKNIDAKVGMEFEMIVPNVEDDDDDDEPDYPDPEMDNLYEPARSIDNIVEFFNNRDYNDRRVITRLRAILEEKYKEYSKQFVEKAWEKTGKIYLLNWIRKNVDASSIADYLDLPEDLLGDRVPTKEDYEEVADEEWERPGNAAGHNYYDQAYESFENGTSIPNYYYDEEDDESDSDENSEYIYGYDADDADEETFLESIEINDMQDVYNHTLNNNNLLGWPSWTDPEPVYNNNGGDSIEEVASKFEDAVGRGVNWSTSYHGARRTPYKYCIEPDSSLTAKSGDRGLEFISPPLPVDEMFDDIAKIKEWADDVGAYTNESCGLHMNVSVPNYSKSNLDYVKLAILSGDQYVLDQFGRVANSYCESALDLIKNKAKDYPQETERLFEKLRSNVEEIASKIIHNGSTRKFTSINTKENWVEFRGPGNDWLNSNFNKIENTVLRFVVALDAACDPQKYRKEYLKGLYKLLKPKDPKSEMSLFARYLAGELNKTELAGALAKKKYQRKTNDELASILSGENDPQGILDEPDNVHQDGPRAQTIDQLTREYQQWCEQQGLPFVSTDEQDFEELTDTQRDWIMRFNARWEDAENGNISSTNQQPTPSSSRRMYSVRNTDTGDVIQVFADSSLDAMNTARSENSDFHDAALFAAITAPEPVQTPRLAPMQGETLYHVTNDNTGEEITVAAGSLQNAYGRVQRNNPSWQGAPLSARVINYSDIVTPETPTYYVSDTAGTIHTLQIQASSADQARRIARLRYPELDSLPDNRLVTTLRRSPA
jgi:hypothetical protein